MSAFSRGINFFALPAPSRAMLLQSRLQVLRIHTSRGAQNFSTTFRLNSTAKPTAKPKHKIIPPRQNGNGTAKPGVVQVGTKAVPESTLGGRTQSLPIQSGAHGLKQNLKASLLAVGRPTVIYEAPKGKMYTVSLLVLSGLCMVYAGYILEGYFKPPEGVPRWIAPVFVCTAVLFTGIAGWIYTATVPRILRMTAVPVQNYNMTGRPGLNIRIDGVRYLPFWRQRVEVPIESVTASHKLQHMPLVETQGPMMELGEMTLFVRPLAAFGRWFGRVVREVRGGISREHFVYVFVKDKYSWKLDVRGRALGRARGFDSIIRQAGM